MLIRFLCRMGDAESTDVGNPVVGSSLLLPHSRPMEVLYLGTAPVPEWWCGSTRPFGKAGHSSGRLTTGQPCISRSGVVAWISLVVLRAEEAERPGQPRDISLSEAVPGVATWKEEHRGATLQGWLINRSPCHVWRGPCMMGHTTHDGQSDQRICASTIRQAQLSD